MTFLVIHERGNWSAIRLAKTIEEAKKELLKMVQEATVEWGDVFRISKGPKSRAAAKHLQQHGYSTDHPETAVLREQRSNPALVQVRGIFDRIGPVAERGATFSESSANRSPAMPMSERYLP